MTKGSIRARRRIRPAVLVLLVVACGASGGAGSSAELARELGAALRAGDAVALEQLHPPAWRDADADVEGELSLLRGMSLDGLCVVVDEDFPVAHSMRFFADAAGPAGVVPWSMRIAAYRLDGRWWAGFGHPDSSSTEPSTQAPPPPPRQGTEERPPDCRPL